MKREKALLAGGCFWGMEEILRKIPGVIDTEVGFCGGHTIAPHYQDVMRGNTGHAETVQIEFDSHQLSFKDVLHYFFRMHDPTTLNSQGNDHGSQYRSVIFYLDLLQKKAAEEMIQNLTREKKWKNPIVTQVIPATTFFPADEFHQDYLQKNPHGYTCHWLRD